MATSSILRNFTIADRETAEAFVNALDEAAKDPVTEADADIDVEFITDTNRIKALFASAGADS